MPLPLPPTRPVAAFKLEVASAQSAPLPLPVARRAADPIAGLIAAAPAASGVSAGRRTELPAIITRGTEPDRAPEPALAFAAADATASLRTNASRDAVGRSNRSLGLRAASAQHRA